MWRFCHQIPHIVSTNKLWWFLLIQAAYKVIKLTPTLPINLKWPILHLRLLVFEYRTFTCNRMWYMWKLYLYLDALNMNTQTQTVTRGWFHCWFIVCVFADTGHARRCLETMSWPPHQDDSSTTFRVRLSLASLFFSSRFPPEALTGALMFPCPLNRVGKRRGRLRGWHQLQWVCNHDKELAEVNRGEEHLG